MSTISSLYSTTALYSSYPATSTSGAAQTQQGLNAIGSALQAGDLSAAQKALAAFQSSAANNANDSSNSSDSNDSSDSTDNPFTGNSQAAADYDAMVKDLQSGNLTAAQKDYATLQTDLKIHGVHHHHGGSRPPAATTESATTDTSTTDGTSGTILNVTV